MSKISTWMPLYIGDYLADTMRLTTEEHGAYLLLLMEYWRQGPLPNDDKSLSGIAKLDRKRWEKEVGPVVRNFFVLLDDGLLHQKRVDAERNKASINSAKKQAAAQARWDKDDAHQNAGGDPSGGANGHAYASADASQVDEQTACPYAGVPPSPSSLSKTEKKGSLRSPSASEGFGEFWAAYPRKIGKGDAEKAYAKALREASPEQLCEAVENYPFSGEERFIPHASTWLNGKRWLDQHDTFDPVLRAAGLSPEDFQFTSPQPQIGWKQ